MITFNTVDPATRASQIFIELNGVKRTVGGSNLPPIGLIAGQYDQALIAGITDYEPVQVVDANDMGNKAGFGSEAHRQSLWIFGILGGSYNNMWWVPIPEPGTPTAAFGTIIFATTSTSGGTFFFSIGGDVIPVNIPNDTDATAAGDLLVTAITANLNGLVTAANVTGTVTLTAKTSGVNGNQISLISNPAGQAQEVLNPTGMTVALPGSGGFLTGGVGATDVHDMFLESDESDKLGDRFYTCISGPYNDATNLGYYKTSWPLRKDPGVKRPFNSFVGYVKEVYSAALALPATINSEGISPVWDSRSYSPNWELQAAAMGLTMWSNVFDPGRPMKTLSTGIPHNSETGDLSYAKNDALFKAGMGYFKSVSGLLRIGDLATSYRTNPQAAPTEEWFDTVSVSLRQQKIFDIENIFKTAPYNRAILADDDSISAKTYVIKPKKVVSDLSAIVNFWDEQGWTKNAAVVKASISAEINSGNNSRLDGTVTDDEAKALRIVAIAYNFLF